MPTQISGSTFDQEVKQSDAPVLIDFYAPWCGPCKMVAPILEEIAGERSDIKIVKIDVDEEQDLARQHNVMSVPTLVLYKGGNVVQTWVGLRSKQVLLQEIDAVIK